MIYTKSVLIVDDEKKLVNLLSRILEDLNAEVHTAYSGEEAIELLQDHKPSLIFLDLRLPDIYGLDLIDKLKSLSPMSIIVVITAYGDVKIAMQAAKKGVFDFIQKPFNISEITNIFNSIDYNKSSSGYLAKLIGHSDIVKKLKNNLVRIASSNVDRILITGETGTGKSLIARIIHEISDRKDNSFVGINCATIPSELFEAELFGAEKGSFTGATNKRVGLVELANEGILFFDEITEIPLSVQAKLLTFIETKKYRVLGAKFEKYTDVKIIAASNKDLYEQVEKGLFRADLFYRLNAISIDIPPLRERVGDLPLLIDHYVNKLTFDDNGSPMKLNDETYEILKEYNWPGNIRELKNLLERLLTFHPGKTIVPQDLPKEFFVKMNSASKLDERVENTEYNLIIDALRKAKYNKTNAAKLLGISRHTLLRKIKKLGIN